MQERRGNARGRTYLGGQVVFNDRNSALDCLVRNLSRTGARIELPNTVAVPKRFDLLVPSRGESRRARVVWRTEVSVGVVLTQPDPGSVVSIETARRIKHLEAERDRLARRVSELAGPG